MAQIKCELHVYDIKRCGLYNKRDLKHLGVSALMKELKAWAIDSGKPLVETSTFDPNKNYLEAFCLGVAEHDGQFLIALWNKIPQTKSGVGMVNGAKSPSKTTISHTPVGKDDIPGYPSFFWVLPAQKKIVAIRIENPSFGISQLRSYITGYLINFCSYRVDRTEGGEKIEGYADFPKPKKGDDSRVQNKDLIPSFSFVVHKDQAKEQEIISKYDKVYKLVRDVYVYNNLSDSDASAIEKIRAFFNNVSATKKKKVRIQMPVDLSKAEVQELVKIYNDSDQASEHNVGFVFKGEAGHIEWLSGGHKKEEAKIDIKWVSDDLPDIEALLKSLSTFKSLVTSADENLESDGDGSCAKTA